MDWVLLSLVSVVAFTAFTIVQKRTLDNYRVSVVTFYAIAALMQLTVAVVVLSFSPPQWLSAGVGVMVVGGLLQATLHLLQGYAIKRSTDISRIVPVLDSYPIFVIIIAVMFLGEVLTPLKWAAALLVVSGAVVASMHQALPGERVRLNRSFVAVVGAAMLMAVLAVLLKVASADLTVLQMMSLMWLFAAPGYLVAARIAHAGGDIRATLRSAAAVGHIGATEVAFLVAVIAGIGAIAIGPVSLSSAIMGTRPVLLLLWAMASGLSFRQTLRSRQGGGPPRARWASACLVTVGVGVMAF
jgi:drug/metabolite transporter (DMT)-like permease